MIKGCKICGISDSDTLNFIINHPHPPKFIGFICNYPKSSRYVEFENLKKLLSIKKNTWFAMKSKGSYSFIGCTVAPAFNFSDLELAPKNWKPTSFSLKF